VSLDTGTVGLHGLDLLGGFNQRLDAGCGVAVIRVLHRHADDGAGLEIDGVLGLVGQVRASIFHDRERRRVSVARWRWLEDTRRPSRSRAALARLKPPIRVSARTVERDFIEIQKDARRCMSAAHFDARFEVSTALARYEMLARKGAARALKVNGADAARWARVAVQATEAKMALLQDVGLIDRRLGVLLFEDGERGDRIPSGTELQEMFRNIVVSEADVTSEAEIAFKYGDQAAAEAAAREATAGAAPGSNSSGDEPS
jgi:hypothetical protein